PAGAPADPGWLSGIDQRRLERRMPSLAGEVQRIRPRLGAKVAMASLRTARGGLSRRIAGSRHGSRELADVSDAVLPESIPLADREIPPVVRGIEQEDAVEVLLDLVLRDEVARGRVGVPEDVDPSLRVSRDDVALRQRPPPHGVRRGVLDGDPG